MKVFLSWSKDPSRAVALELKRWLKLVIQSVEPWISEDIEKGSRWNAEIVAQLDASDVGIVCLTPNNLNEPWLLFEAGAIAKSESKGRAMTFLLGVRQTDVQGPLSTLNHTVATDQEDVYKMVQSINTRVGVSGGVALEEAVLRGSFDAHYPALAKRIAAILAEDPVPTAPARPPAEILEELLLLVRGLVHRSDEQDHVLRDAALRNFSAQSLAQHPSDWFRVLAGDMPNAEAIVRQSLNEARRRSTFSTYTFRADADRTAVMHAWNKINSVEAVPFISEPEYRDPETFSVWVPRGETATKLMNRFAAYGITLTIPGG